MPPTTPSPSRPWSCAWSGLSAPSPARRERTGHAALGRSELSAPRRLLGQLGRAPSRWDLAAGHGARGVSGAFGLPGPCPPEELSHGDPGESGLSPWGLAFRGHGG